MLLVYSASTSNQFWLKSELEEIESRSNDYIRIIFWISHESRLNSPSLSSLTSSFGKSNLAILCGPPLFEMNLGNDVKNLELAEKVIQMSYPE